MPGAAGWTIIVTDGGPSIGPFAFASIAGVVIAELVHGSNGRLSVVKMRSAADRPPILLGRDATCCASLIRINREWLVSDEVLVSFDGQAQLPSQFGDLCEADVPKLGITEA